MNQTQIEPQTQEEVEVFRFTPEIGKYYETAEYTRIEKNQIMKTRRYFANKEDVKYVGKCIKHCSEGYGDNAEYWDLFENDEGVVIRVEYSYEGFTSFREVQSIQDIYQFKREIKDDINYDFEEEDNEEEQENKSL
jgi:hypothetical protein